MSIKSCRWGGVLVIATVTQFSMVAHAVEIASTSGSITALAFSPNGKTIAAADDGFDVQVWDASSGKALHKFTGLAAGTNNICWSPDGNAIYGTTGNAWIAWDVSTGHELHKVAAEMTSTAPKSVALSPDGKTVAAVGRGILKLWSTDPEKALGEYEVHPNYGIINVSFSPDSHFVATAGTDRTVQITEVASGTPGFTFTCESRVATTAFSPAGHTIFIADEAPVLHQFDVDSGADDPTPPLTRTPKQIAISPDGTLVACVGMTLQIWSRDEKRWSEKHLENSAGGTAVAFSPDGKTVACGDTEGHIHLWSTKELLSAK